MKPFLDDHFILETKTAEELYHHHAAKMPLIDYHCHLSPKQISENHLFDNISQAWLYGDHYKWRAMRANGVHEKYCTGNAPDKERFDKWAETVPYTLRNPLYHWTHMELKTFFGYTGLLSPKTADEVWKLTSEKLKEDAYRPQGLMEMANVELVCTTDDPVDSLVYHQQIAISNCKTKVLPTWRPDKAMAIDNLVNYNTYIDQLEEVTNQNISSYGDLLEALQKRHDVFSDHGCKLSDHGVEQFYAEDYSASEINLIFNKIRGGKTPNDVEARKFKSAMLYELAMMDHEKGWTQQFHFGALRNNNTRLFKTAGADIGCDSIGDQSMAVPLSRFLDKLDSTNQLSKTILYNLNPSDNEMLATMIGNFQDGSIAGKMQFGSGWWFLDQKDGMEKQMNALSNQGLLSRFVGMLTDSRSFLSYPRHEYFRRILCNLLGNDFEKGLIPNDMELLGEMVENICYHNAKSYFDF